LSPSGRRADVKTRYELSECSVLDRRYVGWRRRFARRLALGRRVFCPRTPLEYCRPRADRRCTVHSRRPYLLRYINEYFGCLRLMSVVENKWLITGHVVVRSSLVLYLFVDYLILEATAASPPPPPKNILDTSLSR